MQEYKMFADSNLARPQKHQLQYKVKFSGYTLLERENTASLALMYTHTHT